MKKRIGFFPIVFLLIAILTTAGAPYPPQPDLAPETSRYGMNAGIGALDWDPSEMFADVMKTFREVTKPDGVTPVAVDAKGWPLADCRFLVWHGLNRAAGTYHLKFIGSATSIVADGSTVQNIQYNSATNTTTANVIFNGANYMYLAFTGTNGGVKNVQLMMPGHTFSERWNHAFLTALEPIPVIRFMDFTATNWNQDVAWSDRTLPDAATQQSHPANYGWQGKGIAWEYAIDLMNVTNKDGWINIPAEANNAYVQGVIGLIKNGGNGFAPLEADRKLYIEYSNEVWNGMFDQAQYNHTRAVAEVNAGNSPLNFDGETNEWYWAWRRVGKRIVEISDQFRAAFGDAQMMTRFRPVLAWQINNGQATGENQLDFIQKYYGTSHWGYANPHPVNYYLWCGGGTLYYDDVLVAQDLDFQTAVQTDSKYASAYGIHYCNYEGGMYFDEQDDPDWFEPWVTPYMLDHQQYYEEHGGSLLTYFTLAATWENGLGFLRTIRDLNTRKYAAIQQLSQQTQPWENTFGAALPMHRGGGDFSLVRGDWVSPGAGATTVSPKAWRAYHYDADDTGAYRVWVEYSSTANINLKIYAGSDLAATITQHTNGNATLSPKYAFDSAKGLQAIRIENHGNSDFTIVKVHVEAGQSNTANFRSSGMRDGWTLESSENSNAGGSVNSTLTTFRVGDDPTNRQYRSILYFNTASLPDNAAITKVTLKIKRAGVAGTDPFTTHGNLYADMRAGFFGAAPLEMADFQSAASKNNAGRFNPVVSAPAWYQLVMNAANYQFINLVGVTQFRLRFATDDNNDDSADFVTYYSGDYSVGGLRPVLVIEYSVP